MNKLASNLPLQDMIRNVISTATEKLASDESGRDDRVRQAISPTVKASPSAGAPNTSSLTSEDFVEKLASACDMIAANIENIELAPKSVLKQAAEGSPAAPGKRPGALELSQSIGGSQAYKSDKPQGEDPSKSQENKALSTGGLPAGKTQVDNDMHDAPGGGDVKPTGKYPEKGPLVAGPTVKHAGIRGAYINAVEKNAGLAGLAGSIDRGAQGLGKRVVEGVTRSGRGAAANLAPNTARAAGYGTAALGLGAAGMGTKAMTKEKSAAEQAKALILRKLAGEDVLKANIDGGGTTSPLAGEGQLSTAETGASLPGQSGDAVSGMGNQGRRHLQSNDAAINYTKGDAKGPQKTQLKEVLDEPALSPAHDSKLRENLRNAGKAGVKIAAARKAELQKIASEGCKCDGEGECKYCQMKEAVKSVGSDKTANSMMMGGGGGAGMMGGASPSPMGGMGAMAQAGAGADGCTCGGTGECKVCKLKAALAAAMAESGMPVEKDSMGDGTQGFGPPAGTY